MCRYYSPTPVEIELAKKYPNWTFLEVRFFVLNSVKPHEIH